MPRIADFVVVHRGSVTLNPKEGSSDRHIQNIRVPGVDAASFAVLSFRVDPEQAITLQMRLNDTVVVRQTFNTAPQRSWHAVVDSNTLRPTGNELTVSATADGAAKVQVSDIVLFYQADIG